MVDGEHGSIKEILKKAKTNKKSKVSYERPSGYEFKKHQQSAKDRGISRKEFLNEHNKVEHYRPELPSSNRSHVGEDVTDIYLGP